MGVQEIHFRAEETFSSPLNLSDRINKVSTNIWCRSSIAAFFFDKSECGSKGRQTGYFSHFTFMS